VDQRRDGMLFDQLPAPLRPFTRRVFTPSGQSLMNALRVPDNWVRIRRLLEVPEDLELMAVYLLGYLPPTERRPAIDWSSRQRKRPSQYVFRGTCATRQIGWDD
jgi:hypothetical protein